VTTNGRPRREGFVDTNVFVHAQTHDQHSEECRHFLAAVERGDIQAVLEPIVLHELSYSLPRYVKQMTREDIATYLEVVIGWPGIIGDKDTMIDAVQRWRDTPGLAFTDAFLAAHAAAEERPVYTKNVRELRGQIVGVPEPLPSG